MSILDLNGYIASTKQNVAHIKTASRTAVAASWFSTFDLAGNPGAGVLAGTSTAAGVVPTDALAGYPDLNAPAGGALAYVSGVEYGSSVACRISLYDRLFVAGAFAFNAAVTLAAQPSFAGRLPNTDYKGLELWLEQVTAGTAVQNVAVTYTDQDGNAGATTGTVATATNIVGRCFQLPLATGDCGLQKIESVTGSVASAGTFNIMVLRPLWSGRVRIANDGDKHDFLKTGLPRIFGDSALYALIAPDSTATGIPELQIEVAAG